MLEYNTLTVHANIYHYDTEQEICGDYLPCHEIETLIIKYISSLNYF